MARRKRVVVYCEDTQHEAFTRRLLHRRGYDKRDIRVHKAPGGRGAAEQWFRSEVVKELQTYRKRTTAYNVIAMIDGDRLGYEQRCAQLDQACREAGLMPRAADERFVVLVPTWSIETWLSYLEGQQVDESTKSYPRLERPRKCGSQVNALDDMCQRGELRQPAPASLAAACAEYRLRLSPRR
jgi:hypothetical protein